MAKVLIIDDDQLFRSSLSRMFQKAGFQTETANDGQQGIHLFEEDSFDLVITDIIMPVMEGIETILEIQRLKPEQTIIAMSAGGKMMAEKYLNTAKALKIAAVLKKPFQFEELKEVLDSLPK
jgi:DNA-binding response OmpR family regulator